MDCNCLMASTHFAVSSVHYTCVTFLSPWTHFSNESICRSLNIHERLSQSCLGWGRELLHLLSYQQRCCLVLYSLTKLINTVDTRFPFPELYWRKTSNTLKSFLQFSVIPKFHVFELLLFVSSLSWPQYHPWPVMATWPSVWLFLQREALLSFMNITSIIITKSHIPEGLHPLLKNHFPNHSYLLAIISYPFTTSTKSSSPTPLLTKFKVFSPDHTYLIPFFLPTITITYHPNYPLLSKPLLTL